MCLVIFFFPRPTRVQSPNDYHALTFTGRRSCSATWSRRATLWRPWSYTGSPARCRTCGLSWSATGQHRRPPKRRTCWHCWTSSSGWDGCTARTPRASINWMKGVQVELHEPVGGAGAVVPGRVAASRGHPRLHHLLAGTSELCAACQRAPAGGAGAAAGGHAPRDWGPGEQVRCSCEFRYLNLNSIKSNSLIWIRTNSACKCTRWPSARCATTLCKFRPCIVWFLEKNFFAF